LFLEFPFLLQRGGEERQNGKSGVVREACGDGRKAKKSKILRVDVAFSEHSEPARLSRRGVGSITSGPAGEEVIDDTKGLEHAKLL